MQLAARRRRRRGPAREVHRGQPAALGGSRLRAGGGRRRRRGHVRPAGPRPRAGVQPAGDQLHPRHPAARHRSGDGRLPVHRRGLAPVHGPRHAERSRREPEPVLRRHAEVRRRAVHRARHGPPGRDSRGLHPQRLRGRGREARHHAGADGRQPDDVRGLRPRLRRRSATQSTPTRCSSTRTVRPATGVSLHASNANATNCGAGARTDLAKACWAGGTIQIYVNTTLPNGITYAAVRAGRDGRVPERSPTRRTRASRSS